MATLDLLTLTLKDGGYSSTKSRRAVFLCLEQARHPLTMRELVERLTGAVDRASIYRIVALFEKLGIIQRVQIGWKYKLELSNVFQEHHHHLICIKCGQITSFTEPKDLEHLLHKVAGHKDFDVLSHQIELQGLCASCKNMQNKT